MTEIGTKPIDDLIKALRDADYRVVNLGKQFRVSHPSIPGHAFMPHRLSRGRDLGGIMTALLRIGFTEEVAADARERKRKERLEADRRAGERALNEAKARAATMNGNGAVAPPTAVAVMEAERNLALAAVEGTIELEDRLTDPTPPKDEGPKTSIVEMTPQFAADLLEHNRIYNPANKGEFDWTNRKLSQEKALEYRDAMLRGEWGLLTHQGIAFDSEVNLLDGQHRLIAVVLAGIINPDIVVPMMVTYNLDPAVIDRIDTGKRRTIADVLSMHGEVNTPTLSSIARLCVIYDEVPWNAKRIVSATEVRQFIAAEPAVRDAARIAQGMSNQRLLLVSSLGAALHIIGRHYGIDAAELAVRAVAYGEGLTGEEDPAHATRNLLINMATNRSAKRDQTVHLALLIKMWNLRQAGARRKLMRWTSTEPFPRVSA